MQPKQYGGDCLLVITGALALEGGIAAANRLAIQALHDAGYTLTILSLIEPVEATHLYEKHPNVTFQGFSGNKFAFTLRVWGVLLQKRFRLVFCDHINLAASLMPLAFLRLIKYTVRLNGIEVFPPKPDLE